MNYRTQKGKAGEAYVAHHLYSHGYTVLAHNFTKPYGEIDLIAKKNDTLIFVEVKTRTNPLIDIAEVIGPYKQKRIIMAAKAYLAQNNQYQDFVCRFDVALVEEKNNNFQIRHIENAFNTIE